MSSGNLLRPTKMNESQIIELEEKIRRKVRTLFGTPEGEYIPEHSRDQAIISDLYKYTTENPTYIKKYEAGSHGLYEYGAEILETCIHVLNAYSPSNGDFIHYYNASIARTLTRSKGELQYNEIHQVKTLSDNKIRTISKIVRESSINQEEWSVDQVVELAKNLNKNISVDDILEFKGRERSIQAQVRKNLDNDDIDNRTEGELLPDTSMNPEELLVEQFVGDELEEITRRINVIFLKTQERQKCYLRDALTSRLCESIKACQETHNTFIEVLKETDWFSKEVYEEYLETGECIKQKDIAVKHGITNEGLSTAMRKILLEIQAVVK